MKQGYENKSSTKEIQSRFDNDVERFSNLETGQTAAVDAAYCLEMIATCAARHAPQMNELLDIGCGAGNFSIRVLNHLSHDDVNVTLNDLSQNMLKRAHQRVDDVTQGTVTLINDDIRHVDLVNEKYDSVIAAMVLHHLRDEAEWENIFHKIYQVLKPGGALWIYDLVEHDSTVLHDYAWQQYSDYLVAYQNEAYRDTVFEYIEKEDSPRPLIWQMDRLKAAGFKSVDVLHKHSVCAAYCAFK